MKVSVAKVGRLVGTHKEIWRVGEVISDPTSRGPIIIAVYEESSTQMDNKQMSRFERFRILIVSHSTFRNLCVICLRYLFLSTM